MNVHEWGTLAAATGQLALGLLAALYGGGNPLVRPLSLLCFCVFGWNIADLAFVVSGDRAWNFLDHALSPMTAPLFLQFVLVFTGQRRRLAGVLYAAHALVGLLGASAILAFVWEPARAFQLGSAWSVVYLALALPIVGVGIACLFATRREDDLEAWRRSRLILVGLALAVPLAVTDLLRNVVPVAMPRLANLAMLLMAVVLTVVTLRLRLFGRDLSTSSVTFATALALLVAVSFVGLSSVFLGSPEALLLLMVTAALMVGVLVRASAGVWAARQSRETELVHLGRFAAQMGHDLKNPLAAMKGAVQFLLEERRRGASLDDNTEFLELLLAQVARMERSLDEYQRLGRVEPDLRPIDVNAVVREVTSLQAFAGGSTEVRLELAETLPPVRADRMLLGRALENLVRNAFEAMPDGGTVTISTAPAPAGVRLAVRDSGPGMDALTRERATDDFFTTKAQGSGMGLSFARRVALAHGGELILASRPGKGTAVEIGLPAG